MTLCKNREIKPLAYSIDGAAQATSLSASTIDAAIRLGRLPVKHYINRTLILSSDLEQWLKSLPYERLAPPPQLEGKRTGRPKNISKELRPENWPEIE